MLKLIQHDGLLSMPSFEQAEKLPGLQIKENREKQARIAERIFLLKKFAESLNGLIKQGGESEYSYLEQILDCLDENSREQLADPENKVDRQELINLVVEQIDYLTKELEQVESEMATAWQQSNKDSKDFKVGDEKPTGVVELEEKQVFLIGAQKTLQALSNELKRWDV